MKRQITNARGGKKRNRGAAMIVVVCVMMVVTILSLTLLMSAYQMFATVNDEGKDELYYQQAMSFSEVIRERMKRAAPGGGAAGSGSAGSGSTTAGSGSGGTGGAMAGSGTSVSVEDTELIQHFDSFMRGGKLKEIWKADAPSGSAAFGGITVTLQKSPPFDYLVIRISVDDGKTPMAGCTCKYKVETAVDGSFQYTFCGYY